MEIIVNNQQFKKLFLEQISKISDSAVIKIKENSLECKTCTSDNSVILGLTFSVKTKNISDEFLLNVGDVKKLLRAFDCVEKDEITFTVENNNINYKDSGVKFKYHLLENGIINQPKINLDKLNQLNFESSFTVSDRSLNELVKASTFSTDSNKVYLTSNDNILKADLTDKARYNVDSFEINIATDYKGTKVDNLCLNFEIFRILSTSKYNNLQSKIAPKLGVVLFGFENNIITSKYIISALTK